MSNVICFDIGGTFIKYGVINQDGSLCFKDKTPTPKKDIQQILPMIIMEKLDALQREWSISAISISSCGLVDREAGIVLYSNNIPGYTGMNFIEALSPLTKLPIFVENDVKCGCMGEMWKGALQGKKDAVFLTLGTGIGGTILVNGKILNGSTNLAGELGHTVIVSNGRSCSCGRKGCFERYASTSALVQDYIRELRRRGFPVNSISGEEILQLVYKQEPGALKVYLKFVHYLSLGLANIIHLLNPESVIIGGGIVEQNEQLIQDVNKEIEKEAMSMYLNNNIISSAILGNQAGLFGACYNALERLNVQVKSTT